MDSVCVVIRASGYLSVLVKITLGWLPVVLWDLYPPKSPLFPVAINAGVTGNELV